MIAATALVLALHASSGIAYESFDDALARAKIDHHRILLYVHASWCVPCRRLAREFFDTTEGAELLKNVHVVPLDFDADERALKPWAVAGVPSLIVLRPDGSEVDRVVGYANRRSLALRLAPLFHPSSPSRS